MRRPFTRHPLARLTTRPLSGRRRPPVATYAKVQGAGPLQLMGWTPPSTIVASTCHTRHPEIAAEGGVHMPTMIAVDVAKSVFEVALSDRPGRVVKARPPVAPAVRPLSCDAAPGHAAHGGVRDGAFLGAAGRD